MKANELMIGDWVFGTRIKANVKVVAIDSERQLQDIIGSVRVLSDDNSFGTWAQYLEPIPLTAEILEKNGEFGKTLIGETIYRMGGDDYCVRKIGERYSFIRCAEYGASWWLFDIRYVHELQHALCLCGIDKNIEL